MNREQQLDDILVKLWNDLANRQAGQILFKDSMNIMEARTALLKWEQSGAEPDV